MTTTQTPKSSTYATGYAKGRHAAKEHVPAKANPYRAGSPAFKGWNDGFYDEHSARAVAIERHSASIWSESQAN